MKWIVALLLGISAHATTWVLNPDALDLSITVEELTRVLELEGIEVRFETQVDSILWKKKQVSISLAPSPFTSYHLKITIDKTLDDCTSDELAELYEAIWLGRKALADTVGATCFMIFTKGNGFEIIPSGIGDSVTMDAVEKKELSEYVFYNRFPLRNINQSAETIQAIRERLPTLQATVLPEKLQSNWSQKISRHLEANYQNLKSVYEHLISSGALIQGEMPLAKQTDTIHEMKIDLDKCAFCNPKVIQKQLVCEWKETYILLGHKPTSLYGNFLILPKRHQCAWDLTREEAIASFEAVIALKKTLIEMTGSEDWICYIQDGPTVGQTVPHTHIHFFILPDPLRSTISQLQHIHNQRPILSSEEIRATCEKLSPLLLDKLRAADKLQPSDEG